MSVSPRLLLAATVLAGLSAATVIHLTSPSGSQAGRPLFAPSAPPASPPPLVIPTPAPAPGRAAGGLPPVMRAPSAFWDLLNRDTAAATRGQIGLVQLLEDTVRDQVRSFLQHPLGGV